MMKKLTVFVLSGAMLCTTVLPAMAAGGTVKPIAAPIAAEETVSLPNSVLYYGTVKEILKDDKGTMTQLHLSSEHSGEYVMNLSADTVWIDSAKHTAADPSTLKVGETVYVFHSSASTRSLPPQSAAFAVVRNVPEDASCAQYHVVESVSQESGQLKITTDQGGLILTVGDETKLSRYGTDAKLALKDIQEGDRIMAWYEAVALSYPGQAYAQHLMLLPQETADTQKADDGEGLRPLTRAALVCQLYEQAGKPAVEESMNYTDVAVDAKYADAIRWATHEQFISGYADDTFRPENPVNREQFVTILWRYAGRPMLMDYTGLAQFPDVEKVSSFAQQAMMWAHQKGWLTAEADGLLAPQGTVSPELAETMLKAIQPKK